MSDLLVRGCAVGAREQVDVRVRDGAVVEIGQGLRRDGEPVLDARGGALLPGLHDHHLHLHATAAALESVACGPPAVRSRDELAAVLRSAARSGPVRGTGYHESVAGLLDRDQLDAMAPGAEVRVQHRSGAAWFLSSAAVDAAGLAGTEDPAVERDPDGRPTGRVWRGDHLLRAPGAPLPEIGSVAQRLSTSGVTGVTDATPRLQPAALRDLRAARGTGRLPQRLLLLGAPLDDISADVGPWKVVLDEARGLDLDALVTELTECRAAGRAVAIHAVTRAEAVVAVAALRVAQPLPGARLEHGSVLPPELDDDLRRLGVTVVTQPHFVAERGDDYLRDVAVGDRPHLYRCASLLAAGVPVAAGTDAPYGDVDPWRLVAAATARRTRAGTVLGDEERLAPEAALALLLGDLRAPGGAPRQVVEGMPADLCLLDAPLRDQLAEPSAERVQATVIAGTLVFERGR